MNVKMENLKTDERRRALSRLGLPAVRGVLALLAATAAFSTFLHLQAANRDSGVRKGGAVRDVDGNEYQTVVIGRQEWMAGNLRTTRLNDGTAIPEVKAPDEWSRQMTPALAWYGNNAGAHKPGYGALYNWYAVSSGKLCPKGWRVPTDADWQIMVDSLGGKTVAGGKLKSKMTSEAAGPDISESELEVEKPNYVPDARDASAKALPSEVQKAPAWNGPNTAATNEVGFSAVPGGRRPDISSDFGGKGLMGNWWTSSDSALVIGWYRRMSYDNSHVIRMTAHKSDGLSVCCIRE